MPHWYRVSFGQSNHVALAAKGGRKHRCKVGAAVPMLVEQQGLVFLPEMPAKDEHHMFGVEAWVQCWVLAGMPAVTAGLGR